jgi:hypothetical protein
VFLLVDFEALPEDADNLYLDFIRSGGHN